MEETEGDQIQFGDLEYASDFIIKRTEGKIYVYVLMTDLKSQDEDTQLEKIGRIECFEISQSINSGFTMKKKAQYVTDNYAFSTMNLFQGKYLICCNKCVNIFDITDPEDIKLISSHVQHDFISSAEVLRDKYLLISYYTATS